MLKCSNGLPLEQISGLFFHIGVYLRFTHQLQNLFIIVIFLKYVISKIRIGWARNRLLLNYFSYY